MALPPGFTAIKDASTPGARASLIGVITSLREQKKTKGPDWVWEFTIQDDFSSGTVDSSSGMDCRVFQHKAEQFPKINGIGDVAIVRGFKLDAWMGGMHAVSSSYAYDDFLVFPANKIPPPKSDQDVVSSLSIPYTARGSVIKKPTLEEELAVVRLKHEASKHLQQVKQHAMTSVIRETSSKRDRLSLIKDLDFNGFYDIRAQVVNIYWNDLGSLDMKVTDYTSHEHLFLYAEPDDPDNWYPDRSWKGPFGQFTMDVRLYGKNCTYAREDLVVGDFVFLRNVHTKMSQANKLEGVLHEDKQRPDKIDIHKLVDQAEIDQIKKRKRAYEQQRAKKSAYDALENVPKKSSAKASASKKAEKRARLRAQKEEELKAIEEKANQHEAQRTGVNLNIRAAFPEIQPSTISEIIYNPHLNGHTPTRYNNYTLPFVNARHRARVRVVDFFPPKLELFAHYTADPTWDKRAKPQDPAYGPAKGKWEWGFVLLVEDAKLPANTVSEKLRVVVGNNAAQHLLDMDARDLKNEPRTVKRLEEKLFILWGNLYELKTELRDRGSDLPLPPGDNRLQNKPFDCCIEEYGYEVKINDKNKAGYQRLHRLAGTKIQSET